MSPVVPSRSEWLAHAAFAAVAALMGLAAGQPLFTDDTWWHLALGEAFLAHGPRLAADPLLFTAPGPPDPAAWLADAALFWLWSHTGFTGLRVAHVAAVAAILALAWRLMARAARSRAVASLGAAAFVALAAYRLVQLRPELFTIFATLALYALLVERREPPSWRRVALAAPLFALWANAHAAFPLGLALLGAASAACFVGRDRTRAVRLAAAAALGFASSLANPHGVGAYLAWLRAGESTPDLARVADEWARFPAFSLPLPNLPPTPLAFALVWGLLALAPFAALAALQRPRDERSSSADPARLAWALASLAALLAAVRFLWLGLFMLLAGARLAGRRIGPALAAACALALVPAFVWLGDWRMISGVMPRSAPGYAQPYSAAKYFAHPIWFLGDAQLEGNVFTDYFMGGFTGFFAAPALRTFANGSLNLSPEASAALRPIRERRGALPGERFEALLDRLGVDLFVGIRLPIAGDPNRPWYYTTGHLEDTPGWVCIFRNLDSAVYLRANERNRANLERVAAYYAAQGVPFSPARGLDVLGTLRRARGFALQRGLLPANAEALAEAAAGRDAALRRAAEARLAVMYHALGAYARVIPLERDMLHRHPDDTNARRRLVWALLRADRIEEAVAEAVPLRDAADPFAREIGAEAEAIARSADPGERRARSARLPVLTPGEASALMAHVAWPEVRSARFAPRRDERRDR